MKSLTYVGSDLYNEQNFPVMLSWEKPYMEHCINMLHPIGDVLEIGFGSGYSAKQIQNFSIRSHTIIECDPTVLSKLYKWASTQKHPVNVIHGTWQDRLDILGRFDTIFYDDCFLTEHPYEYNMAGFKNFVERIFHFHKKPITKIGWYCESPPPKNTLSFFNGLPAKYELYEYNIKKPENLAYAKKHPDKMFVPQLTMVE